MRTYKHLLEQLMAFVNLYLAFRQARRDKQTFDNAAKFELNPENNLLQLQQELFTLTYQPEQYHNFYIYESKRRLVSAAPFQDRVVPHALCRVIEPI